MARIDPLAREELGEFEERLAFVDAAMGFIPNSMFTMARVPELLPAFQTLAGNILRNPLLRPDLVHMVSLVSSVASGCRYCQAHTGHSAERAGVSADKLEAIWSFETSEHFNDAERAALRLAFHSGQVPNAATDEDFAQAKMHYTDDEVTAIVAVCALFGFLNRWNDTMATTLEESPSSFGERVIASNGWEKGKHR